MEAGAGRTGRRKEEAMKWKLAALLTMLALPGVIAAAWLALPQMVNPAVTPVRLETLQVAAAVQGTLFVLMTALLGALLGPKVGLSAPVLSAWIGTGGNTKAWRTMLLPGVAGGCLGAGIILAFHALAPEPLAEALAGAATPLSVRILYGGITEEVLVRWGLMTLLVWAGWRILQRGAGQPSGVVVGTAIVISALLFGVSHVPSVAHAMAGISAPVVAYVTLGNALFGVIAGFLFWRRGLEAAITAHFLAHVFAYLIRG